MDWLPAGLESLTLRFLVLGCPTFHGRLSRLHTIALSQCRFGCMGHFKVRSWVARTPSHAPL